MAMMQFSGLRTWHL